MRCPHPAGHPYTTDPLWNGEEARRELADARGTIPMGLGAFRKPVGFEWIVGRGAPMTLCIDGKARRTDGTMMDRWFSSLQAGKACREESLATEQTGL